MSEKKIIKQFSTLVVPFVYGKEFPQVNSHPNFKEKQLYKDKVYDHIGSLFESDPKKTQIGKAFSLDQNFRKNLGLPKSQKDSIRCVRKDGSEFYYSILDVDMYLFSTQVGFLCLQLQISEDENHFEKQGLVPVNPKLYQMGLYELKRFYYRSSAHDYIMKLGKTETKSVPFDLQVLIKTTLEPLKVQRYFEQNDDIPTHAKVFSVILMQSKGQDQEDTSNHTSYSTHVTNEDMAYRLSHSYNDSYMLPSNLELASRQKPLFQPFKNSIWGLASEGVANVIQLTESADTNAFFEKSYFQNVKGTYFYLYLLLLNQQYGLLNLSIKAGDLYKEIQSMSLEAQARKISEFREEIIEFTVTSVYKHASYITHQSDWYQLIHEKLGIDELQQELTNEVDALKSHLTMSVEQWERMNEKQRNEKTQRNNFLIQLITYIFLPFTIVTGFFGMNLPMIDKMQNNIFYFSILVIFMTMLLVHYIAFLTGRKSHKKE